MPFTGSHPAAVLPLLGLPALGAPLLGWRLVPAGLVAGSMAPDLPLFVPLPFSPAPTHAVSGIVGIDVVLAAAMAVAWRGLVQPVVVAAAPAGLRARLGPGSPPAARALLRPQALIALAVSGAVGAATHIGWDAFTHADRWGTRRVRWLGTDHGPLPGYAWAQYGSGVVGLVAMGAWAVSWYRRTAPAAEPPTAARLPAAVAVAGAVGVIGAAAAAGVGAAAGALRAHNWAEAGYLGATRGGAAGAVAVVAAGVLHRARTHTTGDESVQRAP